MLEQVFQTKQFINKPISEVFSFFAEAKNLEKITPEFLNFRILKMNTPEIQKNSLIDYQLKLHGIPLKWKTLISEFIPNERFIDEQLKGPYTKWVHTHTFQEKDGGTLIKDHVVYKIPLGIIGKTLLGNYIRNDITKIFNYRYNIIDKHFHGDKNG